MKKIILILSIMAIFMACNSPIQETIEKTHNCDKDSVQVLMCDPSITIESLDTMNCDE
jgi:hypothetical protein